MHQTILKPNLWLKILIGMVLGTALAVIYPLDGTALQWIGLPGEIFIALLKMIIVPLILSSVILGIASAGTLNSLKSMGVRLVPYFIFTTAIAIVIGISITNFVQPGLLIETTETANSEIASDTLTSLTIPDRIMNIIPVNPMEAQLTKNMLQLVIIGIIVGIALILIKTPASKTFRHVCEFTQDASMMVVGWDMWIAPVAVFSLMVTAISTMGITTLQGMGLYMACVVGGLLGVFCFYLIIVTLFAKRNPLTFLNDIRAAQIVAFSTSSSAATMPVSLTVAEERLKTSADVRGFVIPLGATSNMDGTALYQATAALFLCQAFGIDLSLTETLLLLLTTIGASIGTPAMPGVGLIVLATILTSIGVPPAGLGIILGVDRLLDMCRTTINVTGDLTATAVMQQWMHGKGKKQT
jgi:proton glutamate symport protein